MHEIIIDIAAITHDSIFFDIIWYSCPSWFSAGGIFFFVCAFPTGKSRSWMWRKECHILYDQALPTSLFDCSTMCPEFSVTLLTIKYRDMRYRKNCGWRKKHEQIKTVTNMPWSDGVTRSTPEYIFSVNWKKGRRTTNRFYYCNYCWKWWFLSVLWYYGHFLWLLFSFLYLKYFFFSENNIFFSYAFIQFCSSCLLPFRFIFFHSGMISRRLLGLETATQKIKLSGAGGIVNVLKQCILYKKIVSCFISLMVEFCTVSNTKKIYSHIIFILDVYCTKISDDSQFTV